MKDEKESHSYCELFYVTLYPDAVHCWTSLGENGVLIGNQQENYLLREENTVILLRALVEEVFSERSLTHENGDVEIVQHLMQAFFRVLLRNLLTGRYIQTAPPLTDPKPTGGYDEFTTALLAYIGMNLHNPVTLESAAAHLFLSRAQFARRVKQETGKTFVEILTERRLDNARTLLHESDWTTSVIAGMVGFKSTAHFNHLFMRHTGNTPGQYRQISRQTKPEK